MRLVKEKMKEAGELMDENDIVKVGARERILNNRLRKTEELMEVHKRKVAENKLIWRDMRGKLVRPDGT